MTHLIFTAHNFEQMQPYPYYDMKVKEWRVCLRLAKAAGSISQALVNHLELNNQYSLNSKQAHALATGIREALDHFRQEIKLPDGTAFVELPKYQNLCRHFAEWAAKSFGFKLWRPHRTGIRA